MKNVKVKIFETSKRQDMEDKINTFINENKTISAVLIMFRQIRDLAF